MPDHQSRPLVPGDAVEIDTRRRYAGWSLHALRVADRLAEGQASQPCWPETDEPARSSRQWTAWATQPTEHPGASPAHALAAGWLVTGAPTPPAVPPDGRLTGLDVAVKDIIDVAGLPVRNGTPGGLWHEPARSAPVWDRLAAAGARCIGKAATHEMAWGVTTPQIGHPADPERVAGGSSGGSAACVAGLVSPGALGTDTGGSVRIPAALCGVVGFRPTTDAVDLAGVTPLAPEQDVAGPLGRDVATCTAMLEVILDRRLSSPLPWRASALRVGVLTDPGALDPPTARAYLRTLQGLQRAGVHLVTCDSALHKDAGSISLLTMLASSARVHAEQVLADPTGFGSEVRALLTLGTFLEQHAETISRARETVAARTAALFVDNRLDAFLTPTTPCVAPRRDEDVVVLGGRSVAIASALTRFTAWASVAAMPAVSVPIHPDGLPVGAQVIAPPHREDICTDLALGIERLTTGRDHGPRSV